MKKTHTTLKIIIGILAVVTIFVLGMVIGQANKEKQASTNSTITQAVIPTLAVPEATYEAAIATIAPTLPAPTVEPPAEKPTIATDSAMYTYEDMLRDLYALQAYYPQHMSVNELAKTYDERLILEAVIGNDNAPKHIVIQASIHGREYMNTLIAMRQIEELLAGYDTDVYNDVPYNELLNDVAFHIIPMSNPDGVTISQMGIDGINSSELKNNLESCRDYDLQSGSDNSMYWARWKANARGVDLNRNFASGWDAFQGASQPSFEKYKGTAPASEIETQVILDLAEQTNTICVISYHSAGNLIYWDYGSTGEIYEKHRALTEMVSHLTSYYMQSTVQSSTDAAGCSDYFILDKEISAITIENGGGQSPLSINEWPAIWNSNKDLLPALAAFYQ